MIGDRIRLRQLEQACRISIVIPAHNEMHHLRATLEAFARQRMPGGASPPIMELQIFANGCTDATVRVARDFERTHPHVPVDIHEAPAADVPHVGEARGIALDAVASRFLAAGRPQGILASTDADTVVDETWLLAMLEEMTHVDAVGGYVTLSDAARDYMLAPQRLFYDREVAYRRLLGAIEDRFDPRSYDPAPRHDAFVGANFAVTAGAYVNAGGLPRLSFHEDVALAAALDRSGARIRHSFRPRARTSGRRGSRVRGGFGDFLNDLARKAAQGEAHLVRAADATIELAHARRALRAFDVAADGGKGLRLAAALLGIVPQTIRDVAAACENEGERWSRLAPLARQAAYPDEPIEAVAAAFRSALKSSPAEPVTNAGLETG